MIFQSIRTAVGVSHPAERWLLGVVAVLMAAGVIGLWSMTQTLTRLEERVASWTRVFEARFEETSRGLNNVRERAVKMEVDIGNNSRRLDRLEERSSR